MHYQDIKAAHIASDTAMRATLANRLAHADFLEWEARRQREIIVRALAALGRGNESEGARIIRELSSPQAKKGTI